MAILFFWQFRPPKSSSTIYEDSRQWVAAGILDRDSTGSGRGVVCQLVPTTCGTSAYRETVGLDAPERRDVRLGDARGSDGRGQCSIAREELSGGRGWWES